MFNVSIVSVPCFSSEAEELAYWKEQDAIHAREDEIAQARRQRDIQMMTATDFAKLASAQGFDYESAWNLAFDSLG